MQALAEGPTVPEPNALREVETIAETTTAPETRAAEPATEALELRAAEPSTEAAEPEPAADQPPEQQSAVGQELDALENPESEAPADLASELRAAEEIAADEVQAVLTAVLDRLGAAHHRPFTRA